MATRQEVISAFKERFPSARNPTVVVGQAMMGWYVVLGNADGYDILAYCHDPRESPEEEVDQTVGSFVAPGKGEDGALENLLRLIMGHQAVKPLSGVPA
jgi:hypothetical protein